MAKSIIQDEKKCYRCGTTMNLERHHCIFGSGKRRLAEKDGLWVWLCHAHHTGDKGVHTTEPDYKRYLQWIAQRKWMEANKKNIADWIKRYGRNYE